MQTAARSIVLFTILVGGCGPDVERASGAVCTEVASARSSSVSAAEAARESIALARAPGLEEGMRLGHCLAAANRLSALGSDLRHQEGRLHGIAAMVPGPDPASFHVVGGLGSEDASLLGSTIGARCTAGASLDGVTAEIDVMEQAVAEHADEAGCP